MVRGGSGGSSSGNADVGAAGGRCSWQEKAVWGWLRRGRREEASGGSPGENKGRCAGGHQEAPCSPDTAVARRSWRRVTAKASEAAGIFDG